MNTNDLLSSDIISDRVKSKNIASLPYNTPFVKGTSTIWMRMKEYSIE